MITTQLPRTQGPLSRAADAIWVGVPLALRRVSTGLAVSSVDGLYLAVRPIVGLAGPPLAFLFGLMVGANHPDFQRVFTEALWLLVVVAVIGSLSGALGLYLTLGFALGDLVMGDHPQWDRLRDPDPLAQYGSMLLLYVLLAMLAVGVPIAAKTFAAELRLPDGVPRPARALVGFGSLVIISVVLVWVWTQSVPLMVRPAFVWANARPTVAAVTTTQARGSVIVIAAVLATMARAAIQLALASPIGRDVARPDRLTTLENRFRTETPVVPLLARLPLLVRLALRAAAITALLAGLYADDQQAGVTFAVLLVAQVVASRLHRLGSYARVTNRVPRVVKLILVIIAVYLVGSTAIPSFVDRPSFMPLLVLAVGAAVLMTLLSPPGRPGASR
jgi:hypothetical protein